MSGTQISPSLRQAIAPAMAPQAPGGAGAGGPSGVPGGGQSQALGGSAGTGLLQQTIQGATQLIQILSKAPGVDQSKVEEARQMLGQAMVKISEAIKGGGASPGAPGA